MVGACDVLSVVFIPDFAHLARVMLIGGKRSLKLSPGRRLFLLKVLLDGLVILLVDGSVVVKQPFLVVTPRPLADKQCIASRDLLVVSESGQ